MEPVIFTATDRHGASMQFEMLPVDRNIEVESEMHYRIAYGEALKEGVLPRERIRKLLRDNGIWSDADETELKGVLITIAKLERELNANETAGKREECVITAGSLAVARRRLWELLLIQQAPFSNSCEAYADLVRREAQMAASIVLKANGKRYWKNYKEYVLERDTNESSTVAEKAMEITSLAMAEEQAKMLNEAPEQQWLQRLKDQASLDASEKVAQDELNARAERAALNGDKDKLES